MSTRRGVSLVELLVMLSACTTLLTLTGSLLHRAMRVDVQARANSNAERTTMRLSEQFRQDVHDAATVTLGAAPAEGTFLQIELGSGRLIEYSRAGGAVLRTETGSRLSAWREEYVFPEIGSLTIGQNAGPDRLHLTIITAPAKEPANGSKPQRGGDMVPVSLSAEAVVGRNARLVGPMLEGAQR